MKGLVIFLTYLLGDVFQYNLNIPTIIYPLVLLGLFALARFTNKINILFYLIFVLFLFFEDMPRFIRGDFNTLYLGKYKNLFFLIVVVLGILKSKMKYKKDHVIYIVFFIAYVLLSVLHKSNIFYSMVYINVYLCLFILPYYISKIIDVKTANRILKFYKNFVYVYPIIGIFIFLIGRGYNFHHSIYIFFGPFKVFNIGYLIGEMIEKINQKKIIALGLYLILLLLAPSSGELLIVGFSFIYFIFVKVKNKKNFLKKISLIILILVTVLSLAGIFIKSYEKLPPKSMIKLKIKQISDLRNINNVEKLSYSVRVRATEIINVVGRMNYSNFLLSEGFGSWYTDDTLRFPEFDKSSFSEYEMKRRIFYNAHNIVTNIILKFGTLGLLLFIYYLKRNYKLIKKVKPEFVLPLFITIYVSTWGIKVIIVWCFVLGSILRIKYNKGRKRIEKDISC